MLKFFSKRMNNKKGFTLIELIVVIAILAILALIAIPRIGKFRTNAAISSHNANVRTLESAASMCLAEKGLPGNKIEWNDNASTSTTHKWEGYIAAWPEVPKGTVGQTAVGGTNSGKIAENDKYKVEIENTGSVKVTPGLIEIATD